MTESGVRPAGPADLERVAGLYCDLCEEASAYRGGPLWLAEHGLPGGAVAALQDLLDDADEVVRVATAAGAVVGFAVAGVLDLRDGARVGEVRFLYVDPEHRRAGLGRELLAAVIEPLVECTSFDAPALPGHRAAKNFFEQAGFTARLLTMHRPPGRPR